MSLEEEKRAIVERKRNILHLISQYLADVGLPNATNALLKESQLLANRDLQLCDNVDLDSIYLDYMAYHHVRFGKYPKITKRIETAELPSAAGSIKKTIATRRKSIQKTDSNRETDTDVANKEKLDSQLQLAINISPYAAQKRNELSSCQQPEESMVVLPPLRDHPHYTPEWKEMAEMISRDIFRQNGSQNLHWSNVKGHRAVQNVLVESVVMPLQHPELFVGVIRPWKCILLHGVPGTGKTLMARTLCAETQGKVTFFNVVSSTITSKWRGDSEKFIRVLFDLAKFYAPSVIFVDEIDGFTSRRDAASDHEASRRFKNEFLTQIDELEDVNNVFLLASSNLPWELDPAFLRRFERKMHFGLPDSSARIDIIKQLLPKSQNWQKSELLELSELALDFTGDDIRVACKEASMKMVRNAIESAMKCEADPSVYLKEICVDDLKVAFQRMKPSAKHLLEKHIIWSNTFGHQQN